MVRRRRGEGEKKGEEKGKEKGGGRGEGGGEGGGEEKEEEEEEEVEGKKKKDSNTKLNETCIERSGIVLELSS